MKKIVASVGLVALGASGLNAVYGQDMMDAIPNKPWNVSASLRGFYDDNINTVQSGSPYHQGSFGFQISPGADLNWQQEQTTVKAGLVYSLRWYDKKPFGNTGHDDQDFTFNGDVNHVFTERYRVDANDSFVIGQEPDFLRYGYALEEPQRVPGDNIRNYGTINFDGQLTPLFGFELGYANGYTDYHDTTPFVDTGVASLAAALNRIEQNIHLDSLWQMMPETQGLLGYEYAQADYIHNDIVGYSSGPSPLSSPVPLYSDSRNYRSHYGYVGMTHHFVPDLSVSGKVGIRDTDYYNSPTKENDLSPYVTADIQYNYTVGSSAEFGFNYDRNATSLIGATNTLPGLTLSQESAVLYGTIKHQFMPKLIGTLTGQFQYSTFNGGQYDGKDQKYYLVGLDLQYRFTPNLSADVGYNYDRVDSNLPVSAGEGNYDRNRVYIGVTASY